MDFTQFFSPSSWGWPSTPANQSIPGYPGPSGDIGYGVGVGTNGPIPAAPAAASIAAANPDPAAAARNQNLNGLMQRAALGLLQPQQIQAPQIQMARPVGPGQMPQPMQPQDLRGLFGPGGRYGF